MLALHRRSVAAAVFALVTSAPFAAQAQIHWDASAQVGAMKRFLVERPSGASDAGFGPMGEIQPR